MPHRSLSGVGWILTLLALVVIFVWYRRRTRRIFATSSPNETRLMAYLSVDTDEPAAGIGVRRQWPAFFTAGLAFGVLALRHDGLTFDPGRIARLCGVRTYTRLWSSVARVEAFRPPLPPGRAVIKVFSTADASVTFFAEPASEVATALYKAEHQTQVQVRDL